MTIEKEAREIVKDYGYWSEYPEDYHPKELEEEIAKALQKKQERIEELESALKESVDVIKLFTTRPTYKRQQCTSSISWKTMNISTPDLEKALAFIEKIEAKKAIGGGNERD